MSQMHVSPIPHEIAANALARTGEFLDPELGM